MNKNKILLSLAFLLGTQTAQADIYGFNDIPAAIPVDINAYQNLELNVYGPPSNVTHSAGVIDPTPYLVPGVDYTGFDGNLLFNGFGYQAPNVTVINLAGNSLFDFISGVWSAGLAGDATIQFKGLANGVTSYTSSLYLLQKDILTPITLNWFGIDQLVIESSPAIWIADNLEINAQTPAPVPTPAALWLFSTAILGFLGSRRRVK